MHYLGFPPACRLNQALQTLQLRPTYEDVFQVETSTVDEYLQQVGHAVFDVLLRCGCPAFTILCRRCFALAWGSWLPHPM